MFCNYAIFVHTLDRFQLLSMTTAEWRVSLPLANIYFTCILYRGYKYMCEAQINVRASFMVVCLMVLPLNLIFYVD
jgi:hypothetical protein